METHLVTVRSLRVLRGPNLYAYMPVLHAVIDIGPYDERPSSSFPGFVDRLVAWLPTELFDSLVKEYAAGKQTGLYLSFCLPYDLGYARYLRGAARPKTGALQPAGA